MLGAIVFVLILMGYVRQELIHSAEADLVTLQETAVIVQQQVAKRAELERQRAELFIVQRIEGHLGSRVDTIEILCELENLLPPSMALMQLSVETKEVPVAMLSSASRRRLRVTNSATGKDNRKMVKRVYLTLTGLAPTDVDVANFIGQLSASSLFEDVNMGYTKNVEIGGLTARKFQASCFIAR